MTLSGLIALRIIYKIFTSVAFLQPPPDVDQQDGRLLEQSCRPSEGLQYVLWYLRQSISPFIVTLVAYLKLGHAISGVYMCVSPSIGRKTHVLTSNLSQLGNSDHGRI
jgi:hypothetical protein